MKLSKYEKGAYVAPRLRQGRVTLPRVVIASAIVLIAFAGGMQAWSSLRGSGTAANATSAPNPVEETVFTPDGKPISGDPLTIAGVEASERAVNLGLQPLNTGVSHQFKLRNTSNTSVTLGKAGIEVLQGCCPSDPVLTATSIAPGQRFRSSSRCRWACTREWTGRTSSGSLLECATIAESRALSSYM